MAVYDLEDRSEKFAQGCRAFARKLLKKDVISTDDCRQLARASGSCAANYIEANDSLGDKDTIFRMRISRKEVKESRLWLRLLEEMTKPDLVDEHKRLVSESNELVRILSAIIKKLQERGKGPKTL